MLPLASQRALSRCLARLLPVIVCLSLLAGWSSPLVPAAEAVTTTFTPVADSYVDSAAPGSPRLSRSTTSSASPQRRTSPRSITNSGVASTLP